nr:four-carbon acid sugar kinase family protein [uncultured Cohaesibacter sp.]
MKEDHKLAIIADDFTGAGDSGVHFSRLGKQLKLVLHRQCLSLQELLDGNISINSETRFLSPNEARRAVKDVIGFCIQKGYERFYKKIDSTMRGNPGAEIEAALEATGKAAALVCTAMPETGRTCIEGKIYLFGVPLHETDIGKDPFHPLATSEIAAMIGAQTTLPSQKLSIEDIEAGRPSLVATIRSHLDKGARLLIADATCDNHLSALAEAVLETDCLPVGAGGFAKALAGSIKTGKEVFKASDAPHFDGPLLAIVGSLAPPSLRQADAAEAKGGFVSITLPVDTQNADVAKLCFEQIEAKGGSASDILLRMDNSAVAPRVTKEEGARIASLIGQAALALCQQYHFKTVFSTGGETAIAVASTLGVAAIDLSDEIMPGVVLGACQSEKVDTQWFISKAGGFGNEAVLLDIQAKARNLT